MVPVPAWWACWGLSRSRITSGSVAELGRSFGRWARVPASWPGALGPGDDLRQAERKKVVTVPAGVAGGPGVPAGAPGADHIRQRSGRRGRWCFFLGPGLMLSAAALGVGGPDLRQAWRRWPRLLGSWWRGVGGGGSWPRSWCGVACWGWAWVRVVSGGLRAGLRGEAGARALYSPWNFPGLLH